jgi:hypothetical protein
MSKPEGYRAHQSQGLLPPGGYRACHYQGVFWSFHHRRGCKAFCHQGETGPISTREDTGSFIDRKMQALSPLKGGRACHIQGDTGPATTRVDTGQFTTRELQGLPGVEGSEVKVGGGGVWSPQRSSDEPAARNSRDCNIVQLWT